MKLSTIILAFLFVAFGLSLPSAVASDVVASDVGVNKQERDGSELNLIVVTSFEHNKKKLSHEDHDAISKLLVETYDEVYRSHPGIGLKTAEFYGEEEEPADEIWLGDKHSKRTTVYCKTQWDCQFCMVEEAFVASGGIRDALEDPKKLAAEVLVNKLGQSHHLHDAWVKLYCERLQRTALLHHVRYCNILFQRGW